MKNYEEMAQSVLKRRDTEIKRRRRAFLIGAPCAAAALVGVVGIGAAVTSQSRGKYLHKAVALPIASEDYNDSSLLMAANGAADTVAEDNAAEIADAIGIDGIGIDIAAVEPEQIDYTNPNVGQTNISVMYAEDLHLDSGANLDGCDFTEYTLDGLDRFYGLRFSRLSTLYPDWTVSYDKLGTYAKNYTKNDVSVHEIVSNRNTLNYTTEYGGKVTVIAQHGKFEPLSDIFAKPKVETSVPEPEVNIEYDENGNIIGMSTPGYSPEANSSAPSDDKSEYTSTINGYPAIVCAQLSEFKGTDFFVADILMSANVRIIAEDISYTKFEEILDNFTNNVEGPVRTTDNITNQDIGNNDINVLDIDEFNIPDDTIDLSDCTFDELTIEELDNHYHQHFNILKELHPDWKLSYDKLGIYYQKFNSERPVFSLAWDRNTLNYSTSSGAKITVSTGGYLFRPVSDETLTRMKPYDPSKFITEPAIADDGTQIGYLSRPIDPNDYLPEPDEGVSTVNGCEALIYRNADGNFLADIDMEFEIARITAEGLSEEEFLSILDEYTKYKIVSD
ncbi:MAG: hypothetical protein HDR72_05005 [Ruminococcaceae bacterium]|nr:hypothetical protein [Oscillospiraceae bacterium]